LALLRAGFARVPDALRPGCYWWWLDGQVNQAGITRDLEEFAAKGLGAVVLVRSVLLPVLQLAFDPGDMWEYGIGIDWAGKVVEAVSGQGLDAYFDAPPAKLMPVVGKHLPAMREATAIAYCREFTLDELKQLRAFSQTPAGTHYFSKVTNLVGDPAVADANKAYFVDVKALTDTLQGELVQKLRLLRDKSQS